MSLSLSTSSLDLRPHPLDEHFRHLQVSVCLTHPKVLCVALNRPDKRNALNADMWKELGTFFNVASDYARVVMVYGNGSCFCAGIDIADSRFLPTSKGDVAHTAWTFLPKLKHMQDCFTAVEHCPIPVIAVVHGQCIGAGADLLCCTDIAIAADNSVYAVREVALGLAADVGTLQRLPKRGGNSSLVRDVCLTGRNFSAQEALELGLVSRVVSGSDVLSEALALCTVIAQHSPAAVRGTKQALLYARDHSVSDGLDQIAAYNSMALQSNDLPTAWASARSKQVPSFADIPARSKL